jgi:AcrR family transcriptional regulator
VKAVKPILPAMTQSLKSKDAGGAVERPKRRTQAERSGETRRVLLETAIRCLHQQGYAATTTLLVAQEAGLSRGAMLHQFPTRVDLMIFVVQSVFEEEIAIYDAKLSAIQDPRERLFSFPEIVWDVLSRPSGVAVLEILQGSRSDPALAERLAPIQAQIERNALAQMDRWYGAEGTASKAAMRLVVWAIRGLSIAQVLAPDPDEIPKSVALLRRLLEAYVERPRDEQRSGLK